MKAVSHSSSTTAHLISLLLAAQAEAMCSLHLETLEAKVDAAEYIFVAWVESATARKSVDAPTAVEAHFQTIENLKADIGESGSVTSTLTTAGMEIAPGLVYLFFLYEDSNSVGFCGGSQRMFWYSAYKAGIRGREVDEEVALLSRIHGLVASEAI